MHIPTTDGSYIDEETGYYYDDTQTSHKTEHTVTKPHNGHAKRKTKRLKKSRTEQNQMRNRKFAA